MRRSSSSSSSFSRPIPSPSRTYKFPPQLMRFLRPNTTRSTATITNPRTTRTRSRSRSRTRPLFSRNKKQQSRTDAAVAQEPSSPKVTCIGQVRARRSSKPKRPKRKKGPEKTRCDCVKRAALFCKPVRVRIIRPGSVRHGWRKWVWFFQCRSADTGTNLSRDGSEKVNRFGEEEQSRAEKGRSEQQRRFMETDSNSPPPAPPKNAFLLTRCRSAPYRSSPLLAEGLWKTEEEEGNRGGSVESSENKMTILGNGGTEKDSVMDSTMDRDEDANLGSEDGIEGKNEGKLGKKTETGGVVQVRNMVLKRSYSEPARGSGRFDPDRIDFGKQRRLDLT